MSNFCFYGALDLDFEHARQSRDSGSFSFAMLMTFPKPKHTLHVGCLQLLQIPPPTVSNPLPQQWHFQGIISFFIWEAEGDGGSRRGR